MTIRMPGLPRLFHAALLAAMLLVFAGAHAQAPGQRGYWCKRANGSESLQLEPCAPGMEVRSGVFGPDGTIPGQPVQTAAPPAPAPAPAADPGPLATVAPAKKADADTLKTGQFAILKLLGFGLVLGVLAKLIGRSFWRWFIVGCLLRIALVSLNLMDF